jgi:hemoglobin-like flavoprotein
MMKAERIYLVKKTFEQVRPMGTLATELFYSRLFQLDPSLRPMFKGDAKAQAAKLMAALTLVVNGLERPETILPALQNLGRRHAGYGVRDEHYYTVGEALLWTLRQALGSEFTPEVKAAWTEAYYLMAGVMKDASATAVMANVAEAPRAFAFAHE